MTTHCIISDILFLYDSVSFLFQPEKVSTRSLALN